MAPANLQEVKMKSFKTILIAAVIAFFTACTMNDEAPTPTTHSTVITNTKADTGSNGGDDDEPIIQVGGGQGSGSNQNQASDTTATDTTNIAMPIQVPVL